MLKKFTVSILSIFLVGACVSPNTIKGHYDRVGSECIAIGKSMSEVEACTNVDFYEYKNKENTVKDYRTCWPYWGFPFMQSCGGLKIIYNKENRVDRWNAWGKLDGV